MTVNSPTSYWQSSWFESRPTALEDIS